MWRNNLVWVRIPEDVKTPQTHSYLTSMVETVMEYCSGWGALIIINSTHLLIVFGA